VNLADYREQLEKRLGKAHELMRSMIHKAQAHPRRVVFPEGSHQKILRACHVLKEEKIAIPILLGRASEIQRTADELGLPLDGFTIVDPETAPRRQDYVRELYRLRQRRGVTLGSADELMNDRNIFGSMMVRMGDADAIVSGVTQNYADTIRPALQVIGVREGIHKVSGLYLIITRKGKPYFLADATVNIDPSAEDLAEIALCAAEEARRFDIEPRVAMLSFSSFGSTKHPLCDKIRRATELVRYADPTLIIDGEVQGDVAVNARKMEEAFPFSPLQGGANVLIFPNLEASNIACKLLTSVGGAEAVGPILMGMAKPVHLLARGVEVEDIVNITTIAVVDAHDSVVPAGVEAVSATAAD
jgi:malate dehydrogenase (oxaloacetate-decarboxylating)(NADP+)